MEVDRLGKYHGMTKIYENDDVLTKTMQFVDGLQQGLTTYYYKWTDEIQYTQYWFRGKKNGLETWYRSDGVVSRTSMYVNNKKHGLEISYGANIINWREWFNDSRHGKEIEWYPNGGRKREITWHHNVPDRLREWDENGTLTRKYFHVTKGPCSDSHLYPPQIG
jgi:antitoxin component YwqK of YwqJK toxin-antitoxin module